jgi:hypothetical protein
MITQSCPSYPVSIFMAGDYNVARELCREYCDETGFCVTLTPTSYIYTGGEELGFIVGLINYPRFPTTPADIANRAAALADRLRVGLGQESYTIQLPDTAIWHSWRAA